MDKMAGLGSRMPLTSVSSILGLMSMAGIPPLSGFWSKLLIVMAAVAGVPGLSVRGRCA
jgi:formate hydrogenlyase subunit 3/multisubunit Na+/H+ antiporter MnhD subunit